MDINPRLGKTFFIPDLEVGLGTSGWPKRVQQYLQLGNTEDFKERREACRLACHVALKGTIYAGSSYDKPGCKFGDQLLGRFQTSLSLANSAIHRSEK